jgi:hypothetical protein
MILHGVRNNRADSVHQLLEGIEPFGPSEFNCCSHRGFVRGSYNPYMIASRSARMRVGEEVALACIE